ncbi:MAG: LPS export ABC transporter periplasmic protein LptC [Desulfobacteraceae bacterium]|nr:LPS export ABC transporter periplasmic protein LptC [Desulfobacteraceae bacterium]
MGSNRFSRFPGVKGFRRILASVVIVIAVLLVLAFVRSRFQTGSGEKPPQPENTEAALTIKGFSHTAVNEGRTSWVLNAESARLFSARNRAELSDVDVTFFPKDRDRVHLTAQKGVFDTKNRNISISDSVVGRYQGYVLRTESLHYKRDSRIIYTDTHVMVAGDNSRFTADSGKFNIDSNTLTLDGHVRVRMN